MLFEIKLNVSYDAENFRDVPLLFWQGFFFSKSSTHSRSPLTSKSNISPSFLVWSYILGAVSNCRMDHHQGSSQGQLGGICVCVRVPNIETFQWLWLAGFALSITFNKRVYVRWELGGWGKTVHVSELMYITASTRGILWRSTDDRS